MKAIILLFGSIALRVGRESFVWNIKNPFPLDIMENIQFKMGGIKSFILIIDLIGLHSLGIVEIIE